MVKHRKHHREPMAPCFQHVNEVGSRFRGNRQTDTQAMITPTLRCMRRGLIIKGIKCIYCVMIAIAGTFNAYVELTGCTNTKHPSSLGDDTPLLHLLSYSTENESSNDLLYAVICDVVRMVIT